MHRSANTPTPSHRPQAGQSSLAERFWGLARSRESTEFSGDERAVVAHVLEILDALEAGEQGTELSVNTVSFLHLLRQSEIDGDLLYASPEQARGEQMDERSLVFSVGVLIFEKLTGRHPFGAEGNPRRIARIQRAEMASGVNYLQTINGPLRRILLRCMGPFPEERWDNLSDLRRQLEDFLRGDSSEKPGPALPALPAERKTRNRLARASSHAMTIAADREVDRRSRAMPAMRQGRTARSWMLRATWMLAGAAVAFAAVWITGNASSGDDATPAAARKSEAKPAKVAQAPSPSAKLPSKSTAPTPKAKDKAAPRPEPSGATSFKRQPRARRERKSHPSSRRTTHRLRRRARGRSRSAARSEVLRQGPSSTKASALAHRFSSPQKLATFERSTLQRAAH